LESGTTSNGALSRTHQDDVKIFGWRKNKQDEMLKAGGGKCKAKGDTNSCMMRRTAVLSTKVKRVSMVTTESGE